MSRQISISDDVYEELSRLKGDKSFSEFIKERVGFDKDNKKVMELAGALKKDSQKLTALKKTIAEERKRNSGREFDW